MKIADNINKDGVPFAKHANLLDKMEINAMNESFITLKDHKENFINNPKTRLINPAKNEIGRISKAILEKINSEISSKLNINQWKNTASVINWFQSMDNKISKRFCMFDIKDFYPSIKESLLQKALTFAQRHTKVQQKDIDLIMHSRRSLLYSKDEPWVKKENEHFDVSMGAYDGADVCELEGIYLQFLLSKNYNVRDFGLYRDDGLAVFNHINGQTAEKIKKDFQRTFKDNGLDLVITANMKVVNYLDVTLNLNDGTLKPYHKPTDKVCYIHKESNHPPAIIKQLPISIESRLSSISSSQEVFDEAKMPYQEALKRSGFEYDLKYQPQSTSRNSVNRKRKVIWFNPPFNKAVKTKVAKIFLRLIDKHFPAHHKYRQIFNRNTIKVSYSCLPNMKAKINAHNKKVLSNVIPSAAIDKTCNCRDSTICPMNGNCLKKNIMYTANLTCEAANYETKRYVGICATTFKLRYANHKKSFNHDMYKRNSELSAEIWRLKNTGLQFNLTWNIEKTSVPYTPETKRCSLCMSEKVEIALHQGNNLLNKRNEIISRCLHRKRFKLRSLTSNKPK